jgi:hypothetical protein
MYTLENLKPLNASFDGEHKLDQNDVEMVNDFVKLIESTRKEKPYPGDIIEFTDEYGDYSPNTYIRAVDDETGQLSIRICPHIPFIYREDNGQEVGFHNTGGGLLTSVDATDLTYIGKREKLFAAFGHCLLPVHSAIYFNAMVNVWTYTAPDQKHPGYSTKDWDKQYISYIENPIDGSPYHYWGRNIAFKNAAELQRWKDTYKAVEFPGASPSQTILFLYREKDRLVSRKEWDALDLPLDTRFVNGIIHVKVAYDDNAHVITAYRFTNSRYLDSKRFGEYERAKGTVLVPPGPEIK